jgi:hypothetical protein
VVSDSGVRIGPLDLKFETLQSLRSYGISDMLIQRLQPYFNVSGAAAIRLLQQRPLQLSQDEYSTMEQRVIEFWRAKLAGAPPVVRQDPAAERLANFARNRQWPQLLEAIALARQAVERKLPGTL